MKKSENYTKNDVVFEDWWDYTVLKYSLGWWNTPIIEFEDMEYHWWNGPEFDEDKYYIPPLEQVDKFRNNIDLKNQYKNLYNDGDSVLMALEVMH